MNSQQQPPPPPKKKKLDWGDVPGWIQVAVVVVPLVLGVLGFKATRHDNPGPTPGLTTRPTAAQGNLAGSWRGSSQLSADGPTSLLMTLTLGDDGHYAWERDVLHDAGRWSVDGGSLAFEQDTGGQYEWPFTLSGNDLTITGEQGGVSRLHRG